jgi:hypothetical protein
MNYLIVLFKNKERRKIIKKFKTLNRAKDHYDYLIKSNNVIFDRKFENGKTCVYELGFLDKDSTDFDLYFVKDSLGRQVKVDLDDPDYSLTKISDYKIEEMIYDVQKQKKITVESFIKNYLPKTGLKLISKINNKIAVQEDDNINIFSLKSVNECSRFLTVLENYMFSKGRIDCIMVSDSSKSQKKYLYGLLEKKGISKSSLYRRFTTFSSEK